MTARVNNPKIKIKAEFVKPVFEYSQIPKTGFPEIVFSGKSNVGKSSAINELANKPKLAKTSSTPGRTQSINYFLLNGSYYFVDLPGYGYAKVPAQVKKKWNLLLDKYLNTNKNIKLIVQLIDFRNMPGENDLTMIEWLKNLNKNFIIILTKCDKIGKTLRKKQIRKFSELLDIPAEKFILFSIKEKTGIKELWEKIIKALNSD
ncbi:MAG TPA: ribosome biogenesis GTP-binding protein YihA/YsxC [bacterium]|nr:ribosome biogenesis GTP-binding protein YihA/YsxC [bacterium]HPN30327.1 ribosome biogenesis GTP-binding protein YihA/YsxC [bacterium]